MPISRNSVVSHPCKAVSRCSAVQAFRVDATHHYERATLAVFAMLVDTSTLSSIVDSRNKDAGREQAAHSTSWCDSPPFLDWRSPHRSWSRIVGGREGDKAYRHLMQGFEWYWINEDWPATNDRLIQLTLRRDKWLRGFRHLQGRNTPGETTLTIPSVPASASLAIHDQIRSSVTTGTVASRRWL